MKLRIVDAKRGDREVLIPSDLASDLQTVLNVLGVVSVRFDSTSKRTAVGGRDTRERVAHVVQVPHDSQVRAVDITNTVERANCHLHVAVVNERLERFKYVE